MQLHNIKRNKTNRKAKQVGRGGTRGKTSGKGTKGQNARSGRKKRPEMRDIIKRLPKLRGRGKNFLKSRNEKLVVLNMGALETAFVSGDTVNVATLLEKRLIHSVDAKMGRVKILGAGALTKKLTIEKIPVSAGAKKAIELAGGSVV